MLKKIIPLLLLSFSIQSAHSQKIYFCTKVSNAGIPGDPSNYWSMKKGGGTLTVVYKQESPINDTVYTRVLVRKDDQKGVYVIIADRAMEFVKGRNFQLTAYTFEKTGSYRLEVYNSKKILALNTVTIASVGQEQIPVSTYKHAKMTFYTRLKADMPYDTGSLFNLSGKSGKIRGYITNDKPLLSSNMYVQILRKAGNDYLAIDNFNFFCEPTSKTVSFDIPFNDGGTYEIVVRNEESTLVKAAPVKIYLDELINEKEEGQGTDKTVKKP